MYDLVNALMPLATKRSFKKGAVLLHQGEAPCMAYVIKSGNIKVYTINNTGEEQIVTMHSPYELIPGSWIFNKAATAQYYYETASACELLTVPRDVLRTHIYKPEHIAAVLDYYVTNYAGLMMRVTALEQSRAAEKILLTMHYLLFRYGKEVKPGMYKIALPLTHNAIASLVGLTRETTTTELNRLKRQGVLRYVSHIYTVNKKRLEHLLGEDVITDVKRSPDIAVEQFL